MDMDEEPRPHAPPSPLPIRKQTQSPHAPVHQEPAHNIRSSGKVRLRHEDSQIHFDPIISSPSNPLNQESQVLTERQREMIERQRETANLFSDMQAPSETKKTKQAQRDDNELPSDATNVYEGTPDRRKMTPLKNLASLGPMDVFIGSSPTPHSRSSRSQQSQQILSDDTEIATPTAVRSMKLAEEIDDYNENETPGSSPPPAHSHHQALTLSFTEAYFYAQRYNTYSS